MDIKIDDLRGPEIKALLHEHLLGMAEQSPPESMHALDLDGLRAPGITFWTIWEGDQLAGCGALKELDAHHAEIKSMRTSTDFLRRGVARQLLQYMLDIAQQRQYKRLSLETGSMIGFRPARELYAAFGFEYCEPFANYIEDPNSVFMTKVL